MTLDNNTHERFIQTVATAAIARISDYSTHHARKLASVKLCYGIGLGAGYRGVTVYNSWHNGEEHVDFLEVTATGETSAVQLAGTTIHELGHVLAGCGAGHEKEWKLACELLGLNDAVAAGQNYTIDTFSDDIRTLVEKLVIPKDGRPALFSSLPLNPLPGLRMPKAAKGCPMGIGVRGGKTRGTGSGSRLRLYICECAPSVKVRIASDDFRAHCDHCDAAFKRVK